MKIYSKDPARKAAMYELRRQGFTYRAIAERFGVSPSRVYAVCCEMKRQERREGEKS